MVVSGSNSDKAEKRISMDGFKRMKNHSPEGAHIRVFVNTGTVRSDRSKLEKKTTTKEDKETGKKTSTTSYWYSTRFSANPWYKVYDPKGNILASASPSYSKSMSTRSFNSLSELNKRKNQIIADQRKSYNQSTMNGIISSAHKAVSEKFDYRKRSEKKELYIVKKHTTTEDYEMYYEQIKKGWSKIDPCEGPDAYKKEFGDALAFYEKEAQMEPGNKKENRVFIGSNYNSSLLYFYLGDFENAVKYANRVLKVDPKHKKSKAIIERAQAINTKMEMHNIKTMHYCRDVSNAMAPGEIEELEIKQEELEEENNLSDGKVFLNGKEVVGTFQNKKGSDELHFGNNGNVKFVSKSSSEEVDLAGGDVSSFAIGERNFSKLNFAPSAKGGAEQKKCIMEELYSSDKISLFKYFPIGGELNDEATEFAFQKTGQADPVSLLSTDFLILKKGLSKYFSDCPDLKTMCEEGALKKSYLI